MRQCEVCKTELTKLQRRACSKSCSAKLNPKKRKRTRLTNGYREIYHPDHNRKNKYIREHILVMSKHIGRDVKYPENVHHLDGDKLNNNIKNLHLCKNVSEHTKIHKQLEDVARALFTIGFVEWDKKDRKYKLQKDIRKVIQDGLEKQ